MTTMPARDAAAHMWSRTDLGPADVDVAELYDGFSWLAMAWLEALGFCGHGESGPFIEGGQRIALDGEIPLNTNGGQLSEAFIHGQNNNIEAVRQIRGTSTSQVDDLEFVLVAGANTDPTGAFILRR